MLPHSSAPSRVLACVQCQQRKVRCNRQFPCANCIKQQTNCVPATPTQTRRKRLPERELLACLRRYEQLLRNHGVPFEPLYDASSTTTKLGGESELEQMKESTWSTPTAGPGSDATYEPSDLWDALGSEAGSGQRDTFDAEEANKTWEQAFLSDDHLLFGHPRINIDISTLQPNPVHIFRLWQVFLDNVNPLLKVVHAPSVQVRIIEAASNASAISPPFAALMFGIYCMAVRSLSPEESLSLFETQATDLLANYQFACQQALVKASFLRSDDPDCITALLLLLTSTHALPQSLSSILSIAVRNAERIALHSEASHCRHTILTAEMRRRLWWALVLFDARITEMANAKMTTLAPTWDCKTLTNVGDSDLRAEMKHAPAPHQSASDSIFAVVRSELGDFLRNAPFHLQFTNPALKPIARQLPDNGSVSHFERMLEAKYLKLCDPENPIHFMTLWVARGLIAKYFLLEHYYRFYGHVLNQTEEQCDAVLLSAFRILESDTMIMASPITKGFQWYLTYHFPFPAYVHIVRDLRKRPLCAHAPRAWEAMSANHAARFRMKEFADNSLSWLLHKTVFQAWEALQEAHSKSKTPLEEPRIITSIKQKFDEASRTVHPTYESALGDMTDADLDKYLASLPLGFAGFGADLDYGPDFPGNFTMFDTAVESDLQSRFL